MRIISVAEAAAQIGVSPRRVRKMLADDLLPGHRVGRGWAIEQRVLEYFRDHRAPAGRPWRASSAWAVLAIADGNESEMLPVDRSRARRRLADHGLAGLVDRLAARAQRQRFYAHPSILQRLEEEPDVVRSGASAAADYQADLIVSDFLEAYVPASRLRGFVDRYGLDANAEQPNVLLRAVDDVVWPFAPDAGVAPRAVVVVDLLEADDDRSRRAGAAMAAQR